jgi:hypothetical protein
MVWSGAGGLEHCSLEEARRDKRGSLGYQALQDVADVMYIPASRLEYHSTFVTMARLLTSATTVMTSDSHALTNH